jgi:ubiquinone/menaquinone biosynthesis C-methylase UbiE
MSKSLLGYWWDRLRGRLEPTPCPFSDAAVLDLPARALVAGPERILGAFGLRPGDRVLEIGPGTGYYSLEAARRIGETGRLICLDLQVEMLLEVRRRARAARQNNLHLLRGDVRAVPLQPSSIDQVFLVGVLGEIPERARALDEIRRVLKPEGRLSVSEQMPDPDFVTKRSLRRALSAAGFVECSTRGHLFYTSTWHLPRPPS